MSEFTREHRSAPGSVDDPTRASAAFATINGGTDPLAIHTVQPEICYFRRTP
jgi:hypothetical protein